MHVELTHSYTIAIYPDSYWVTRLRSAGPDNYNGDGGGSNYCAFYGCVIFELVCLILVLQLTSCCCSGNSCDDTLYVHDVMSYPGGNLGVGVADGMGCFFCD